MGNRAYVTVLMPEDATDPADKRLLTAWNEATKAVERQLSEAKAQQEAKQREIEPVSALRPVDIAGIAAEPWRQLRNAAVNGVNTPEIQAKVAQSLQITVSALLNQAHGGSQEDKAQARQELSDIWLRSVVDELGVEPSEELMQRIRARHQQYAVMAEADSQRLREGDFVTSEIESKAPPLPERKVTYEMLIDEWVRDSGGIREIDGVGISQQKITQYKRDVQEIIEVTKLHYPSEVDIHAARAYLNYLQEGSLAYSTKRLRMTTAKNLFSIAVRVGLLDSNPFALLKVKKPKGTRDTGYRPFKKEELIQIFKEVKLLPPSQKNVLPLLLLTTGARLSDIACLRHKDFKRTKSGIWFIDIVDAPKEEFPRTLKGGVTDERQLPLHPFAIERGALELVDTSKEGYVFDKENRSKSNLSGWFKRILERLELYELRTTGFHSLRGTAIDMWRGAGIPQDVRHALTGHSSNSVQERNYGEGLKNMPEILHKEITKVDFSFLP